MYYKKKYINYNSHNIIQLYNITIKYIIYLCERISYIRLSMNTIINNLTRNNVNFNFIKITDLQLCNYQYL